MATNTTTFSVRMDRELKNQCETLYNKLGMNLTTAINVFFAPLSLAKDLFSKDLIQTTFEFNALKDENGLPVINSGNMLNQDAIIQIVDYFEQNKIPLNTVTFNTALQLYSANTLFLNEDTLQNDGKTLK